MKVAGADFVSLLDEKVGAYLAAGVSLVCIINPGMQTVQVHRPDAAPVLFNVTQELSGKPQLPGFRVPVSRLFSC
jgi:Uma2 family endonuclease